MLATIIALLSLSEIKGSNYDTVSIKFCPPNVNVIRNYSKMIDCINPFRYQEYRVIDSLVKEFLKERENNINLELPVYDLIKENNKNIDYEDFLKIYNNLIDISTKIYLDKIKPSYLNFKKTLTIKLVELGKSEREAVKIVEKISIELLESVEENVSWYLKAVRKINFFCLQSFASHYYKLYINLPEEEIQISHLSIAKLISGVSKKLIELRFPKSESDSLAKHLINNMNYSFSSGNPFMLKKKNNAIYRQAVGMCIGLVFNVIIFWFFKKAF